MTYDGSLTVFASNSVRIPHIRSLQTTGTASIPSSNAPPSLFYGDSQYNYFIGNGSTQRSELTNPASFTYSSSSYAGTFYPCYITPVAIGDYFYTFSLTNDLGAGPNGANIFRAHISTPQNWEDTFAAINKASIGGALYMDGTYIWIFGGLDSDGNANLIQRAAYTDPLTWTSAGTLPNNKQFAGFAVVGSSLYLYGGNDETGTPVSSILSAAVGDPTTWTVEGSALPTEVVGATTYVNDTTVYLLGGLSNAGGQQNLIYSATIGTPTVMSQVGTIAGNSYFPGKIYVSGTTIYFIYSTGVMKANVSDPLTWTDSALSMAASTTNGMVGTHNGAVYVFGGISSVGAAITTIQVAAAGKPDTFAISTDVLPAALSGGVLIKTSTHFYILGGQGTTGNYYRATLSAPTVWTLVSAGGPSFTHGRAFISGNYLWYVGGESNSTTNTTRVYRAVIRGGAVIDESWTFGPVSGFPLSVPSLGRSNLVVSGKYAYLVGGTSAGTVQKKIWRADTTNMFAGWVDVGALFAGFTNSTVLVLNNYAYIICGGTNSAGTIVDNQILSCSMIDLANGVANFVSEDSAIGIGFCGATAVCLNDTIFIYGISLSANGSKFILRTGEFSLNSLAMPRVPENALGMATIDNLTGTLGSYSSFQKTGMLPWHITDA